MNKGLLLIGLGVAVVVLLFGTYYYRPDDSSEGYNPGDVIHMRVPPTGMGYKLSAEPAYVRYYLKNPIGDVAHVEDHEVVYKKSELLGWSFYDEHQITIGAFPMEGMWVLDGEIHSTTFGIIDIGTAFPTTKTFYVKANMLSSLFAPIYLHGENPLSILFGGIDITLPALIYLIGFVVFLIFLIIVNNHLRDEKMIQIVKKYSKGGKK